MRLRSLRALAVPALLLAACGGEPPESDDRTASGEVLEGSLSDAMIPLDRLESQPPLMRSRVAEGGGAESDEAATGDAAPGDDGPGENPLFPAGTTG